MCSVASHHVPMGGLSNIDGSNGLNIYPATKHASRVLSTTVRREIAAVQAPIRVTVSPNHLNPFLYSLLQL